MVTFFAQSLVMETTQPYIATMAPAPLVTAEELMRTTLPGKRVELVRGVLKVSEPPGIVHGAVVAALGAHLLWHVRQTDLGIVVAGDAGFWLERDPDTVRGPDVAFIRLDRVPHPMPVGYGELAPDLVVEVLSPSDRPGEVLAEVGDWLSAGSRLVWLVDPERRLARVYRADGSEALLGAADALDGEDVVPGFSCRLAALF